MMWRWAPVALISLSLLRSFLHDSSSIAEDRPALSAPADRVMTVQREDADESPGWGNRLRGWWRRGSEHQKNHASVKAAYRAATIEAGKATAQVLCAGREVALATVVDAEGYLVTKASLLSDEIVCRFGPDDERKATLVGVSEEHDLALLKVDASDLTAIVWRTDAAPPGTLVAAVAPDGDAIGIGVVSAEERAVAGPRRSMRGGWLGVSLDDRGSRVLIQGVTAESAAVAAGLQVGDELRSVDGIAIRTVNQVIETVGSRAPGDTLALVIRRQDEQFTISAVLGKRPPMTMAEDQWGGGPFSDRRQGFPRVLPHDTIVMPNQCGGPLIDTDGKALGVNIARALRVVTYALPADVVQQVVAQLK